MSWPTPVTITHQSGGLTLFSQHHASATVWSRPQDSPAPPSDYWLVEGDDPDGPRLWEGQQYGAGLDALADASR